MQNSKNLKLKPPLYRIKIPAPVFIFFIIIISAFYYFLYNSSKSLNKSYNQVAESTANSSPLQIIRDNNFNLIKPILFVEEDKDDASLLPLKANIEQYVEQEKKQGVINTVSVYIEKLNSGNFAEINPAELYEPASMMKVGLLLAYLKEAEDNPGYLNKQFYFDKNTDGRFTQTVVGKSLESGKTYILKDLLYYMTVYSDNNATMMLNNAQMNEKFDSVLAAIKMPVPDEHQPYYLLTAKDYAHFFKVLFNASYLDREMSQYALSLLTQGDYKEGLLSGIDSSVKVAHKFGERTRDNEAELHEFGIVYLQNNPYLIGVMTKGHNVAQLSPVISSISKMTFDVMKTID